MSYQQKRGKNTSWRNGLMRNLATELIIHERLEVTETRAKELRKHVDKLVTLGKRQDLHSRRRAASFLRNIDANEKETALQKLFDGVAKKYKNRNGGYTRILKLDNRKGDNAPMVIIELV
ncbi:50S ribosomal protein L17 [Spiroplasma syrphidicola EA-1]|uniref:Large ribosomal subunit protein bL17 n=2 Tax=Spiroplasma TaxID=2132 RepID=R4U370_9MOLU|nr:MULTISPECIES: 50S ribosomal protein L17 [Spiroplasma]AGM24806.1 50S ribosomal protein L17 [Spiroplasma chrysopicola DF-1]AGM25837.1 50S ribosomal protein L17 [Spiroplasma syrphidicola EA-1]